MFTGLFTQAQSPELVGWDISPCQDNCEIRTGLLHKEMRGDTTHLVAGTVQRCQPWDSLSFQIDYLTVLFELDESPKMEPDPVTGEMVHVWEAVFCDCFFIVQMDFLNLPEKEVVFVRAKYGGTGSMAVEEIEEPAYEESFWYFLDHLEPTLEAEKLDPFLLEEEEVPEHPR